MSILSISLLVRIFRILTSCSLLDITGLTLRVSPTKHTSYYMYSDSRRTSEPHGSLATHYLYCMFSIVFPSESIPLVALIGHPVLLVPSLSYSDRFPPVADRLLKSLSFSFLSFSSLPCRSLIGHCRCLSTFCRHAFLYLPLSLLTSRSPVPLAILNIACGFGKSLCCNPLGRTGLFPLV